MKRLVICVLILAVLLCAAWVTIGAEDIVESADNEAVDTSPEEADKPAWQIFVEEKLAPTVASVLTSALAVYIMAYPVLSGVKKAGELFGGAAGDAKRVSESGERIKEYVDALGERIASSEESQKRTQECLGAVLKAFALACTASEEFVKSGAARALMEAVESYERKETE